MKKIIFSIFALCASFILTQHLFAEQFSGPQSGHYGPNTITENYYFGYQGGTWSNPDSRYDLITLGITDDTRNVYFGYADNDPSYSQPLQGTINGAIIIDNVSKNYHPCNIYVNNAAQINGLEGRVGNASKTGIIVFATDGSKVEIMNSGVIDGFVAAYSDHTAPSHLEVNMVNTGEIIGNFVYSKNYYSNFGTATGTLKNYGIVNSLVVDGFVGGTMLMAKGSTVKSLSGLATCENTILKIEAQQFVMLEKSLDPVAAWQINSLFGIVDSVGQNKVVMDLESADAYASITAHGIMIDNAVLELNFTGTNFVEGEDLILFDCLGGHEWSGDTIMGGFSDVFVDGVAVNIDETFRVNGLNFDYTLRVTDTRIYLESVIPEPSTIALLMGLATLGFALYRKRR